jgi:hypothetical protein
MGGDDARLGPPSGSHPRPEITLPLATMGPDVCWAPFWYSRIFVSHASAPVSAFNAKT